MWETTGRVPKQTPRDVKEQVLSIKAEHETWGAGRILAEMERRALSDNRLSPAVSEPTIRRILARDWSKLAEERRREYRQIHWPATFERGDLPWEAAPACFQLLRLYGREHKRRPTVRMGRWYWRLGEVAPGASELDKARTARFLAGLEAAGHLTLTWTEAVEAWLMAGADKKAPDWTVSFTKDPDQEGKVPEAALEYLAEKARAGVAIPPEMSRLIAEREGRPPTGHSQGP